MDNKRAVIASLVSAGIGVVVGWIAHEWVHRADREELAQKRANDAQLEKLYAESDRRHQKWWENLSTEQKIHIEMRRAERTAWDPEDEWDWGLDDDDNPEGKDDE